jgi:hypothetical protein
VEVSRKHGSFDTRWPCARKDGSVALSATSPLSPAEVAEELDWDEFSARYFDERSRHDSEARSAYAAYKHGREWRTKPVRLSLVPPEPVPATEELGPEETGTRRLLAAVAAVEPRRAQGPFPTDQM